MEVIQNKILSNDSRHYKKELENERPNELSADHEHTRKRKHLPDIDQVSRYMESLRAFSVILRNSELVDDVALKRSSFDLALEMWANASIAVIVSLPEQTREIIEGIAGGVEEKKLGKSAGSLVRAIIPQVMVAIIAEVLATPKLQLFIRERAADSRTLVRVLSVFLALDSDDLEAMRMIEDLLRDFRKNSFVVEMVFFKLLTIHMTGGSMANHGSFRELMGNSFVLLRGAQGQEANLLKGRFLNQLDKKLGVSEDF